MNERRLIEELIPVRAISYEATREKLLRRRDYHISMLHLWWARRPLAAARAAVYATLLPAEYSADRPDELANTMRTLCEWGPDRGVNSGAVAMARKVVLEASGGEPPKVLDCFSGGGAIALEVGRLGGQAYATELNPVAYLISLCTLVYPQTYGPSLADEVEKWGERLVEQAREQLADLYPPARPALEGSLSGTRRRGAQRQNAALFGDGDGTRRQPVAYLWTRTMPCPSLAGTPHALHLVRQTWLVKKLNRKVALQPVVNRASGTISYEVVEASTEDGLGFDPSAGSTRGSATCRVCGRSVTADDVKKAGKTGNLGRSLMGAVVVSAGRSGKQYLGSEDAAALIPDDAAVAKRLKRIVEDTGLTVPTNPLVPDDPRSVWVTLYGLNTVGSLFDERQVLLLLTLCSLVRRAHDRMLTDGLEPERAMAIATYLAMAVDRVADRCSTLCHWDNSAEKTANTFARQGIPMVWDYSETCPFGGSSGDIGVAIKQVAKVVRHCADSGLPTILRRQSADEAITDGPFDAVITDPPYYDNIPYSDLSVYFYAWLQRSIGHLYPEHLSAELPPTRKEIIAAPHRHGGDGVAARRFYDDEMAQVFKRRYEELKPGAPLVVVYAHKTYAGWATLVNALRRAGFVIVEAWPLDTEMPTRSVGQGTASLASSIFLVARRRETDEVGQWTDIQPELSRIVRQRVAELPAMGVGGDDLVIAAIGAGLRPYTSYASVEMPNGDVLEPEEFLHEVQREVVETILSDIFGQPRSGISGVDPVTQLYVMGRFEFGTSWVEFDRANTLARGVGAELAGPTGLLDGPKALFEKDKGLVRLRDQTKRGKIATLAEPHAGRRPPLIDVLHRLLVLAPSEPHRVRPELRGSGADAGQVRLVAQALSGEALERKGEGTTPAELSAIATLLGSWKRLVDTGETSGELDL
jgi:putative DNA methylase